MPSRNGPRMIGCTALRDALGGVSFGLRGTTTQSGWRSPSRCGPGSTSTPTVTGAEEGGHLGARQLADHAARCSLPEFCRRLPPCCCCCCLAASAPGGGPLLGSRTGGGGGRFRGPESGAGVAARAAAAGSARQGDRGRDPAKWEGHYSRLGRAAGGNAMLWSS
jgi:hypothetical protein